jgi:hypothetical protein
MKRATVAASHVDWLSLVETTGLFLTVPVVRQVFPNGIDQVSGDVRSEVRLRLASPAQNQAEATVWTRWVLSDLLRLREVLLESPAVPERATHIVTEHGVALRPEYAVADSGSTDGELQLRMSVLVYPRGTQRDRPVAGDRWAASPIERATVLHRATGVPLVMATDGDWFSVVASPPGGTTTSATWISSLFAEEPSLLDSFVALLGARRFFAVEESSTLPAMLTESALAQEEVTNRLGTQVRQAVELLVGALSRANRVRHGELLKDVAADQVYAAGLTVMMRLVFLLYAEERDLLPARDELYAESYGASGLRESLQDEADRYGAEALERRSAGWHRLLATFRAIHGGIEHDALRLPAYGGGLFDPDRYPFLEGRRDGEPWKTYESHPLPVDDRSILAILDALQVLTFRDGGVTEARRLSYRSLDVEQIGHVYEGLLDHGAVYVTDLAVGLRGKTSDGPELAVELLEDAAANGRAALVRYLVEQTGRSQAQVENGLANEPAADLIGRLRSACEYDETALARVEPYLGLMEEDLRGLPMVFLPDSVYVTKTTERRDTGTQYTPKDLADEIVKYALEPLVYDPGPAEGAAPTKWRIRKPEDILGLRVCDPAVGSGAILVAACRYLSERLVEAARAHGSSDGSLVALHADDADVALVARRLVVDHCLYGVDQNPLAAEMAKLSLWLITLAKERPFTFLDHAIRVGDSLLGITSLDQVRGLHLDPQRGRRLHSNLLAVTEAIDPLVNDALEWIRAMRDINPVTVADVEDQRGLSAEADKALERVAIIADALVGKAIASEQPGTPILDERLKGLAVEVRNASDARRSEAERLALWTEIHDSSLYDLDTDRPPLSPVRRPLHWPIAFPEVFLGRVPAGFDAIVGNPPFKGGKAVSTVVGKDVRRYLVEWVARGIKGSADLVAYFYLRAGAISAPAASVGLLATNTIAQGDTREVGLDQLTQLGWTIYRAVGTREWPGAASVEVSQLWLSHRPWEGLCFLDSQEVPSIPPTLTAPTRVGGMPKRLVSQARQAFVGSFILGAGFILSGQEARRLIEIRTANRDVILPVLNGEEVVERPDHSPSRWVINFHDWSLEKASSYPEVWALVEERVRPDRQRLNTKGKFALRAPLPTRYWIYADRRPGLYQAVGGMRRVLVISVVSKVILPVFVPTGPVWSHALVVFAYDDDFHFGVLSSAFHWWWTVKYASTLESRIRYTPTDVFETFPQPEYSASVETAGRALDEHRRALMVDRNEGLTKTYNRLNNPGEAGSDIAELRRLHIVLDEAVASAYGWEDLVLGHDFQETRIGVRFTVAPSTQTEMLDRLLELNHARYAREQAEAATRVKTPRRLASRSPGQLSLVGED